MVEDVDESDGVEAVLLTEGEADAGLVGDLPLQPHHLLLPQAHQPPILTHLVLLLQQV